MSEAPKHVTWPLLLNGIIRPYAWGSRTFLAGLQGRAVPAPTPEAELWLGVHPGAPATVNLSETDASATTTLTEVIAADPDATLGPRIAERFSNQLPYLLKVLAAAQPLSLQAHPNAAQAQAGFDADERAGIPLTASNRRYQDPRHKPELIVALTPFWALYGFRPLADTLAFLDALAVPALAPYESLLKRLPATEALRACFESLLKAPLSHQTMLANEVARGVTKRLATREAAFRTECEWLRRLADLYPGDIGIAAALFMNVIRLEPMQALYLPAGNLHAYLEGAGIEIMASSDNVLRGGLTPKPIHVAELLRILSFDELPPVPLLAGASSDGEFTYATTADEFQLSRLTCAPGTFIDRVPKGPEILLATEGSIDVTTPGGARHLTSGGAAFISAALKTYRVGGRGTVFRVQVPSTEGHNR